MSARQHDGRTIVNSAQLVQAGDRRSELSGIARGKHTRHAQYRERRIRKADPGIVIAVQFGHRVGQGNVVEIGLATLPGERSVDLRAIQYACAIRTYREPLAWREHGRRLGLAGRRISSANLHLAFDQGHRQETCVASYVERRAERDDLFARALYDERPLRILRHFEQSLAVFEEDAPLVLAIRDDEARIGVERDARGIV